MNVLFDLDGTLTDPREGILACFKHALHVLQVDLPTDPEIERFIGPPLWESFSTLVGASDEAKIARAVALYRERFATRGMFENGLYPGIADALAMLQKGGTWLYVATSKPRVFAERIVEYFGLEQYFRAVHGSELDGSYADKSELIAKVLRSESLTPDETVMIGDRAHDVVGAKANGIFSVGALWGFGSRDELVLAGADLLCKTPDMLVETMRVFDRAGR
ncbi:MAG TPA: HAD hydrolase-like protein [Candidatus Binatia bacterium]|nr:HAD hydrolase-like protein [Candidatus Binatia bacterium]